MWVSGKSLSLVIRSTWVHKLVQSLGRTVWKFLKKLKIELPYDPAISLLGTSLKALKSLFQRAICILMFIAAWFTIVKICKQPNCPSTDELSTVHTNNKVLFSFKNEGNSVIFDMYEPWGHNAKWNNPVTEGQILHDSTHMRYQKLVKLIETGSRMEVPRDWRAEEIGSCYLTGIRFQLCKMNNF